MATIRHEVVNIIKKYLYLCQINSDLYETLNLRSWGTNQSPQVVYSRDLPIQFGVTTPCLIVAILGLTLWIRQVVIIGWYPKSLILYYHKDLS